MFANNKDDKKGGKAGDKQTNEPLGPDGKPLPPVPLTETQQVQLQIEDQSSKVGRPSTFMIVSQSLFILSLKSIKPNCTKIMTAHCGMHQLFFYFQLLSHLIQQMIF